MYRDELLDLYKNPLNEGVIEDAELSKDGENPSCGDDTKIYLKVSEDNIIEDIKHETDGCAISTASISIISDELKGKKLEEVLELDKDWMLEKLDVEVSPMRLKCAMLGLKTVKKAVEEK